MAPRSAKRKKRKATSPTMMEVAEAANVSIFTVSAVVNGTSVVSEELRKRVEAAIAATEYKPSILARSLRTGRTKTVGLVVGGITNPFYTDVVAVIQRHLQAAGYMVMLCCNDRSVTIQEEQVELLRSRMVDGLIISPTGDDALLRKALAHCDVPVVLIDRVVDGLECDAVIIDNRAAVTDAMQYLLSLGHRRIGFVSGLLESYTGRERLAGYYATLDSAGIEHEPGLVQLGNFRVDEAYSAVLRLMTGPNPPTAIFPSNNLMVIGVMKALRDLGLSCPEDVSVAGLDDFPWADAFKPYLTTVEQPVRAIGERAAQLLLERMDGCDTQEARTIVLQGKLKIRDSCLPAVQVQTATAPATRQRRPALSGDPS